MPVKEKGNTKPTIQPSNAEKHRQQAGKKEKKTKKVGKKKDGSRSISRERGLHRWTIV